MPLELEVAAGPGELVAEAADRLVGLLGQAVAERGFATVALTGGSSPRPLYALLAEPAYRDRVPWNRLRVFVGDERLVPPDSPDSNFGQARRLLLDHVPIDPAHLHPVPLGGSPDDAARAYQGQVVACVPPGPDGVPRFDLVLLGLGDDAHIASLFPGAPTLGEADRWVVAAGDEAHPHPRVTLTPPVIRAAREVLVLVYGAGKRPAVLATLEEGDRPIAEAPARLLRDARGRVAFYLDAAAAPIGG